MSVDPFVPIVFPTVAAPVASIVIIVSSFVERLLACLRALQMHAAAMPPFEVVIVLNAPLCSEVDRLRCTVSGATVLVSTANLGLAGGGNRARRSVRGRYIVLLHDDTVIEPGWLEALVATADANPNAGAVGSRQTWPDGSFQAAGLVLWNNGSGTSPWLTRPLSSTARRVDTCGTSSLLVRTEAWDAIGGLDENFYPAYYVDSDLCMALYQSGYVVLVEPASTLRHWRGESSNPFLRQFLMELNCALFKRKWLNALAKQVDCTPDNLASCVTKGLERLDALETTPRGLALTPGEEPFDIDEHAGQHFAREREIASVYARYLEGRLTTSAIPLCRPGVAFSFAVGSAGLRQIADGDTYAPEDWGVWIKEECRVFLPLARDREGAVDGARTVTLVVAGRHFCCAEKPASPITIIVNGVQVADEVVSADGDHDHRVDISNAMQITDSSAVILIRNAGAKSPASLGLGSDHRKIGVGLRGIGLEIKAI